MIITRNILRNSSYKNKVVFIRMFSTLNGKAKTDKEQKEKDYKEEPSKLKVKILNSSMEYAR